MSSNHSDEMEFMTLNYKEECCVTAKAVLVLQNNSKTKKSCFFSEVISVVSK